MMLAITAGLPETNRARAQHLARATLTQSTCGVDGASGLGPLFTLVVEPGAKPMRFP